MTKEEQSESINARAELAQIRKAELAAKAPDARRILRDERMRLETAIKMGDADDQARTVRRLRNEWRGY